MARDIVTVNFLHSHDSNLRFYLIKERLIEPSQSIHIFNFHVGIVSLTVQENERIKEHYVQSTGILYNFFFYMFICSDSSFQINNFSPVIFLEQLFYLDLDNSHRLSRYSIENFHNVRSMSEVREKKLN